MSEQPIHPAEPPLPREPNAYTGGEQVFTVPAGVTSLHIVGIGGRGGADGGSDTAGGFGSVVTADLSVTPGQLLYIEVGGNGKDGQGSYSMGSQTFGGAGGFNGGAKGGGGLPGGGGGGGASDVRTSPQGTTGSLDSRLLVAAGGGGGAGGNGAPPGGAGGAGGAAGDSNSSAATDKEAISTSIPPVKTIPVARTFQRNAHASVMAVTDSRTVPEFCRKNPVWRKA